MIFRRVRKSASPRMTSEQSPERVGRGPFVEGLSTWCGPQLVGIAQDQREEIVTCEKLSPVGGRELLVKVASVTNVQGSHVVFQVTTHALVIGRQNQLKEESIDTRKASSSTPVFVLVLC